MIKLANNLANLVIKQAELTSVKQSEWWNPMSWFSSSSPAKVAPPPSTLGSMESQSERDEARQEALDKQMQAAGKVNQGPQQVRGGALIKPDGKAVDPARQAQVDAANNARKAIGRTAPAVAKPIAPAAKPKGVPSGQGGAGIDEY
jgi:hypothetical protein